MWAMIESLPAQYRWAADLDVPAVPSAGTVLVCGMGGSGISGDFVRAALEGDRVDVRVHKDYGLPGWVEAVRPLVIAVTYSGNTAETLSSINAALDHDLAVGVVTTGGEARGLAAARGLPLLLLPPGLQPRAAAGYSTGAALRLIERSMGIAGVVERLEEAAAVVAAMLTDEEARRLAAEVASDLENRVPIVWGSRGPAGAAARRWAKQFHENAKVPAYWSVLPELDHNELVGWAASHHSLGNYTGIVLLRDRGERPEISRRFALTSDLLDERSVIAGEVWSVGETRLARTASLGLMGDMVSVLVAEAAGVDPVPVDVLTELKNQL